MGFLQIQIITMQSSIIETFQESSLLSNYTRYPLTYYTSLLERTAKTAHTAILKILAQLAARMIEVRLGDSISSPPLLQIPGAFPVVHPTVTTSLPQQHQHHHLSQTVPSGSGTSTSNTTNTTSATMATMHTAQTSHPSTTIKLPPISRASLKLFCPHVSVLLGRHALPCTSSMAQRACQHCTYVAPLNTDRAWSITLPTTLASNSCPSSSKASPSYSTFFLTHTFFLSSHRQVEDGAGKGNVGFACLTCARYRRYDTVCNRVDELASHIWEEHTADELEGEEGVVRK
ncbi:hypothetical protein BU24DRAFT_27563 [Aaosphaeria arxii CBS 175.79]|uniref:C2H2-type domain-containing protein n=1 Tax=Aaosphaeria arxii CBS 175.79 TaxID=1450172 RepID=A0A6A5Y834_9PLEO|nr:uncharacterized protein BU24DRAFT_27563 [Aaosphaeria arxii CBS 175.79]KAF2021742.1 hypothetical protein BU24DRAFT_27563 [Aaosphaeria arxii CBS 175.79]